MPTTPGWYADPSSAPQQRFHDGNGWTSEVRPYPAPKAAPGVPQKRRGGGLIRAGLAMVVIGIILVFLAFASSGSPTPLVLLLILAGAALAVAGFWRRGS